MLAEHQLEAADRATEILLRRGGVLLADEVGLGKSFVAAEVMRRLGAETDLLVPAALVEQWRAVLREFGVDAHLVTHDGVASDPFMPRVAERLVVVDEAHAFRNPKTRRYAALARRTAGARVLLVTATPLCNSIRDLAALLRIMVRDDVLADRGVPSVDVAFERRTHELVGAVVAALVIRRGRGVLPPSLLFGELERSVIRHEVPSMPEIDLLEFPMTGDPPLLRRFLRRRLESSEVALLESLRRQLRFYDRALAAIAAGRSLPKRDYRHAFGHEEDGAAFQEVLFWELFAPAGQADAEAIRREAARLRQIESKARLVRSRKRDALLNLVKGEREPIIVFTGAVATARDLHAALSPLRRTGLVTARERSREAVLSAFRAGRLDVVVSTDMAAEGLNLQRAGCVVHYDIPWNPVRLDQRNGRAWRIGQQRESVRAVYFIPRSRETRIVETVARKNRMRRRVLDSVPAAASIVLSTLRPRLPRSAACVRLESALGETLPEPLARSHRAGLELIVDEMSREFLDSHRLEWLIALAEWEETLASPATPHRQ